jgi:hypothetical protein
MTRVWPNTKVIPRSLLAFCCTLTISCAGEKSGSDSVLTPEATAGDPSGAQPTASASPNGSDPAPGNGPEPNPEPSAEDDPDATGTAEPDSSDPDGSEPAPSESGSVEPNPVPEPPAGADEFTRLTLAEYRATVQQAFGVDPDITLIPVDGRVGHFTSNATVNPDPVHPYLLASEDLAARIVPTVLPACEAADVDACLESEFSEPLAQLLRRPVSTVEMGQWAQLIVDLETAGATPEAATRSMLAAVLLSPDFLFRSSPSSLGPNASARRLVERLSYALWDAPPDAELTTLAAGTADEFVQGLPGQAARLTSDARAVRVLSRFLAQWLDVDTDLRLDDPEFETSPPFLELLAFVEDAVANNLPVTELIAGDRGFVHRDNLEAYGLETLDGDADVAAVTWPVESSRRGLLGQDLIAASTRHPDLSRRPIFRGLLVRRSLMCDTIPAPSADLVALAAEVGERTEDPRCSTCHQLIDPIGQAFAPLDPDAEGAALAAEVIGNPELVGTYADLGALLEAVAGSRAFAECFSRHWLSFLLERPLSDVDAGWESALADSVVAGATLSSLVEQSVMELELRAATTIPWCEGE